ncbi:MAG: flagellar assembly protein FliW [Pseudomonadota bacterium]
MRTQNAIINTAIPAAETTIDTRLGTIQVTDNDIFYFNDGLVGFPNKIKFTLTDVPGIPTDQRYGLLQSLEEEALSFIVHYPVLDEVQQNAVLLNIQKMVGDESITKDEIGFALLVLLSNGSTGQSNVSFVTDAPLVFLSKTQEAWQMINGR